MGNFAYPLIIHLLLCCWCNRCNALCSGRKVQKARSPGNQWAIIVITLTINGPSTDLPPSRPQPSVRPLCSKQDFLIVLETGGRAKIKIAIILLVFIIPSGSTAPPGARLILFSFVPRLYSQTPISLRAITYVAVAMLIRTRRRCDRRYLQPRVIFTITLRE